MLLVIVWPDFTIAALSDGYARTANMQREKMVGKNFFDIFFDNPSDTNSTGFRDVRESMQKILKTKVTDKMNVRRYDLPRAEGGFEVKYWGSTNTPILNAAGDVEYIVRKVEDVTDLVLQQNASKSIEEERDLFFEYSIDLIAIVGNDGYFKRLNPAFERKMGYTPSELCAKPITEFLHPDDVEKTKSGLEKLSAGTPTKASINRYRCKDGSYKTFSWNTAPIGANFYTVGRDITQEVKNEEKIRHLNEELAKKNEDLEKKIQERLTELSRSEDQVRQLQKMDAVGRLAGGIAHDFNNMLGSVFLYCDLLQSSANDPEAVRENAKNIKDVTDRATALTKQLLVFSRKQVIHPQVINLNTLVSHLEKMLVRLIGDNIRVVTKLADDLKMISADTSQLEQVILNLVVNARDAMPQGGTVTIETSDVYLDESFTNAHISAVPGYYVLLTVSDTGTGMDTETKAKIFEPFFTTKPIGKGTGMGLTTTYGIVKQNQGTIWVYSEPGQGTVFKVYLPITDKEVEKIEATPVPKFAPKPGSETILLVEDDESLRNGFLAVLQSMGYQVLVAEDGEKALETSQNYEGDIHLLMTDMVMPGINGVVLAQKVLASRKHVRVLYMSGYTHDTLEGSAKETLREAEFIQKPFDITTLLNKVQEILQK